MSAPSVPSSRPTPAASGAGPRAAAPPYSRSTARWWRRDPFFVRYMWREATALGVAVYALVLMWGLVRLSQGEAAWQGWVEALKSPLSLLLHALLLASMVFHAQTWFEIMPKTMPAPVVGGQKLAPATITRLGWAAAVGATVFVLALVAWRYAG